MQDILYTPAQVAERLQVKERTVSTWLKSGRMRGTKCGRLWRIPPESLDEIIGKKATPRKESPIRQYTETEIAQFLNDESLDEETRLWMKGISNEWHDELADEREDIYTLEDGEPIE